MLTSTLDSGCSEVVTLIEVNELSLSIPLDVIGPFKIFLSIPIIKDVWGLSLALSMGV